VLLPVFHVPMNAISLKSSLKMKSRCLSPIGPAAMVNSCFRLFPLIVIVVRELPGVVPQRRHAIRNRALRADHLAILAFDVDELVPALVALVITRVPLLG